MRTGHGGARAKQGKAEVAAAVPAAQTVQRPANRPDPGRLVRKKSKSGH